VSKSLAPDLTRLQRIFLEPKNALHRQYEALRAFFVEGLPSATAARRFGYTPGSFRVLCHALRRHPDRDFFRAPQRAPAGPPRDRVRDTIVALRKQNLSIYDINRALAAQDTKRSPAAIALILKDEGFERLPRRRDEERPAHPRAATAEVADVRSLDLTPREVRTRYGGLWLFVPFLARIPWDPLVQAAGLPGSTMVPAAQALRSLLGLKWWFRSILIAGSGGS
jgi:hypothetical protein